MGSFGRVLKVLRMVRRAFKGSLLISSTRSRNKSRSPSKLALDSRCDIDRLQCGFYGFDAHFHFIEEQSIMRTLHRVVKKI